MTAMVTEPPSGRVLLLDLLKTRRRQGRKPACLCLRQAPGGEACLPREELQLQLGRKPAQVHSRPLVGLSLGIVSAEEVLFWFGLVWFGFGFSRQGFSLFCYPGCPRIQYVDQTSLKLEEIHFLLPPECWD